MKPTIRKLKSFVKEERETSKLYNKLGFKRQGHDEHEHSEFFEKKIRELKKKKKKRKKKSIFQRLINLY